MVALRHGGGSLSYKQALVFSWDVSRVVNVASRHISVIHSHGGGGGELTVAAAACVEADMADAVTDSI